MSSRLLNAGQISRAAITFAAVLTMYALYSWLAVPFIEPVAVQRTPNDIKGPISDERKTRHEELLKSLYPDPNMWQRQRPKLVETEDAVLMLSDYRTLDDGRMEIKPCTLLFIQKSAQPRTDGHPGRVVVLDAPDGAILQFDEDVDLRRGEFGRLVGGRLAGEVTIRSNESEPGADDRVYLATRNVNMDERRLWTPSEVSFRYGRSYGKGRDLIASFLPAVEGGTSRGPNIGGLKSLEIVHLDRLHLVAGNSVFSDDTKAQGDSTTQSQEDRREALAASPVEVTCKGPFIFDLEQGLATFEEQVDVLRLNPDAPSDQLNCRWMEVHFGGLPAGLKPHDKATEPSVTKLVALGYPVILNSPSLGAHARGERLEYDVAQRQIRLDGEQPVLLDYQGKRIEALAVQYTMPEAGRVGQAWAQGPGRFRAEVPLENANEPPRTITATWQDELLLRPDGDLHVLSLLGDARIGDGQFGGLQAGQLHLWLKESAADPMRATKSELPSILPDRLLAENAVKLESPALTGSTQRFEVWFHHVPHEALTRADASTDPREASPQPWAKPDQQGQSQFDVTGELLRVQLAVAGREVQLRDVSVEGNAKVEETQLVDQVESPVRIAGDFIHVSAANSPQAKAVVAGKPAMVSGRGVTLKGTSIHLDRALNRVSVPGEGEAMLPLAAALAPNEAHGQRQLAARPVSTSLASYDRRPPKPASHKFAHITWVDGMDFDGETVKVRGRVEARTDEQRLTAPLVEINLTQRIDFSKPPRRESVDVQQIRLRGQVTMENRTVDGDQITSMDEMVVRDLTIDQQTGALTADGPGWMKTVRRGSNLGPQNFAGPALGQNSSPRNSTPDDTALTYLRVTFQSSLTGNVHQRHVRMNDGVRAVYGPVKRWDDVINPDEALQSNPNVVLLTSDTLQVAEMGKVSSADRTSENELGPVELQALGNAMVEGKTFTARAHRIAYAQSKDLLVMEGDGRTDAELYRQTAVGGQTGRASARKILYWPGTGRMDIDTFNSLDWSGTPAFPANGNVLPEGARDYLRRERESRPQRHSAPPR